MKRYHITVGAKTTADGTVMTGYPHWTIDGQPIAREGDEVACPACDSTGVIVCDGPHLVDLMQGRPTALDGDLCHCKCDPPPRLIANQTLQCQEFRDLAPDPRFTPPPTPLAAQPADGTHSSGFASVTSHPAPHGFNSTQGQEPGFYIVPKSTTRELLEANLFSLRDPAVMGKFQLLNPYRHDVKAGSMIVLSDPSNWQCSREEALLMEVAEKVNAALQELTRDEADFTTRHREQIEAFLTEGSAAIGIGEVMFSRHLGNVKSTLEQLETLHQSTFQRHGNLHTPEFFSERNRLLSQLNNSLSPLVRRGIGIPEHPKLKSALGISSRSLVHHWSSSGTSGGIPGYATHIDGVVKASKYIKVGGWVGIGLGASGSALKIRETCHLGREEECRQVKYTESGKFAGGLIGGALGAPIGGAVCLGLSVTGLGAIVCGVIMVGLGSAIGGAGGEAYGEEVGEVLHELTSHEE
ncbi:PAAR domain-containing protein [Pseudomonas sp. NPDC087626]|uniref:PAAR domain-containing protein n=1 Tax=Pseudomonas sp. NPDC087626 TaxID=3364444 RepID=UPI0037F2C3E2